MNSPVSWRKSPPTNGNFPPRRKVTVNGIKYVYGKNPVENPRPSQKPPSPTPSQSKAATALQPKFAGFPEPTPEPPAVFPFVAASGEPSTPKAKRPGDGPGANPFTEPSKKRSRQRASPAAVASTSVDTTNRFSAIADSAVHPMDTASATTQPPAKAYKIPAIVVKTELGHDALLKLLDAHVTDKGYFTKPTGGLTKVTLKNIDDYRAVTTMLKEKNVLYHTYALTKQRSQRFVVRGLPASASAVAITDEITGLGFKVKSVVQLMSSADPGNNNSRKPFPLFTVTLEPNPGQPPVDVSTISRLQRCVVSTEAARTRRGPVQCYRCQRVGHTSAFCHQQARCVRCGGDHRASSCPRDTATKCCNCPDGNHPASYRGCAYLKRAMKNDTGPSRQTQPAPRPTMRPRLEVPPPAASTSKSADWPALRAKLAASTARPKPTPVLPVSFATAAKSPAAAPAEEESSATDPTAALLSLFAKLMTSMSETMASLNQVIPALLLTLTKTQNASKP